MNDTEVTALQPRQLRFVEQGMLGFEEVLDYELSAYDPNTPFYWLRAQSDPDVAFIVMEPIWLLDDYSFDLGDEDTALLEVTAAEDIFVLVVCTVPENPLEMTANLLGPLVFHRQSNRGRQVILDHNSYPVRFPVFGAAEPQAAEAS